MATEPVVIEEPARRVSPPVIAAIVVGALVLLALLWFLIISPLLGPDEEDPTAIPSPGPTTPLPSPAPSPTEPPAETFEVFEAKDPFRPLVVVGAPAAGGGATGGGATGGGTTGGATGGGTAGEAAGGGAVAPGAGDGAAGGAAPTGGQRVQVLDIFTDDGVTKAQIRVGSTVFTVAPGEVFADNFKLVSISGDCATLLHGDDKFTLCEGEEVFK